MTPRPNPQPPVRHNTLDLRPSRQPAPIVKKRPFRLRLSRRWFLPVAGVLLVASAAAAAVWYVGFQQAPSGQAGMQLCVSRVGKLMILPTGETPTYGTVSDKTKLKGQTFFAKAENGDEILIYAQAKLSILYRSSINKIVNVGPLVVGNSGSPYVDSKIAIENGSGNSALLEKMAAAVTKAYPNTQIVKKSDATRSFPTSIVIDVNKVNQPLDEQIADSLGVKAGVMPLGEAAPDGTDFLIIIGQDYK
jgi:hypothetical protein